MKRTIIIGLAFYSFLFMVGGISIIVTIQRSTLKLDHLIMLHQVEILREHYLIQIKRVQADLTLSGGRHSRGFDTVVSDVQTMGRVVDTCFDCHHRPEATARLRDLKVQTGAYKEALSRVLTIRANAARYQEEQDRAFRVGENLIEKVSDMIAITGARLEANTRRTLEEIGRTKRILYLLVGVGPVVSVVLGFILVTGLTRPLRVLLESTRRLKKGQLDHRVAGLKDEFGELAAAFNDMAASLKEQMQRMQRAEQMMVVGQLAAGLAHEIKNPLAGIKVAMEVLFGEPHLNQEDRDVLWKVSQEVTRLETLMKSFLSFAKPPKPQLAEVDFNALVNTSLAFYAKSKKGMGGGPGGLDIERDLETVPVGLADPMQLQQVFLNLLINALDAMPEGGTLTVRSRFHPEEGMISLDVEDSGKGIDPADAEKIFQPFFTTKPMGTGLGLAISRQLVEQNGGTITAEPREGGGTRFRIRLPLRRPEKGSDS